MSPLTTLLCQATCMEMCACYARCVGTQMSQVALWTSSPSLPMVASPTGFWWRTSWTSFCCCCLESQSLEQAERQWQHVCPDHLGRRTEQAKVNLDPRVSGSTCGLTSGPTSVPTRSPMRAPTAGPTRVDFPCFQPFKDSHESSHEPSHEGVHGSAHESVQSSGRGSLVLFSPVLFVGHMCETIVICNATFCAQIASH